MWYRLQSVHSSLSPPLLPYYDAWNKDIWRAQASNYHSIWPSYPRAISRKYLKDERGKENGGRDGSLSRRVGERRRNREGSEETCKGTGDSLNHISSAPRQRTATISWKTSRMNNPRVCVRYPLHEEVNIYTYSGLWYMASRSEKSPAGNKIRVISFKSRKPQVTIIDSRFAFLYYCNKTRRAKFNEGCPEAILSKKFDTLILIIL